MPSVPVNTSATSTVLVNAPGSGVIRVWGYNIKAAAAALALTLKSGSTVKDGPMDCGAPGDGLVNNSGGGEPCFDCAAGDSLILTQTGTVQLGGSVRYSIAGGAFLRN